MYEASAYDEKTHRVVGLTALVLSLVAILAICLTCVVNVKTTEDSTTSRYTACAEMDKSVQQSCVEGLND